MPLRVVPLAAVKSVTLFAVVTGVVALWRSISVGWMTLVAGVAPVPAEAYSKARPVPLFAAARAKPGKFVVWLPLAVHDPLTSENLLIVPAVAVVLATV